MKVSDYIIEFLISKNVTDMFGYPGGVITHVMDSVTKYKDKITAHALYHEQACAFAACSYAQATHNIGVAFSTSGPGATNLVTGIANAYYDSIPVIFLTGNVDTYISRGNMNIRQRGFQETDFVSIVKSITNYSVSVEKPEDIRYCLEKAYFYATGQAGERPGPVILDLPADIQRANIDVEMLKEFKKEDNCNSIRFDITNLVTEIKSSKRPVFLIGTAVKQAGTANAIKKIAEVLQIPVVTSMPSVDIMPSEHKLMYGFIGTNGHRYANFIMSKADLVIAIGARLDLKQVGNNRANFIPNAKLYRVDIDGAELAYKVRDDETAIHADVSKFLNKLSDCLDEIKPKTRTWLDVCSQIKGKLSGNENDKYHNCIRSLSEQSPENINVTVDIGQSSIWAIQSFRFKNNQNLFVSAGLGSMGYSLPAAIGAYYANRFPVVCFNGDAGIQMNIQELAYVAKEHLPIIIVILNNASLGMIRQFQEKNFDAHYFLTTKESGYHAPDFEKIAYAYGIKYKKIESIDKLDTLKKDIFPIGAPYIVDVQFDNVTYLNPNFAPDRPINDMYPFIDRDLYSELVNLEA